MADFFSIIEEKIVSRRQFASQAGVGVTCFSHIEGWFKPVRLHSGIGYRSLGFQTNVLTVEADKKISKSTKRLQ